MFKRSILFVYLLLCATGLAMAQNSLTIRGRVVGQDDGESLVGASVALNPRDSVSSYKGRTAMVDANGNFKITTSSSKITELGIDYLGYATLYKEIEKGSKGILNLGTLELAPRSEIIEQVVVRGEAVMSQMKGDTVQFNAAAFKVNPDATSEDLLKKMPGVETDADGNIKSQGQAIAKVYVNGKEFFDDDPSLALKTLAADAVENIQMYDDMSEDAKFSGFDDGVRVRSINITTKKGVDYSTFGKAYAGYGTDGRYAAGLGLNIFNGKHRVTLIAGSDNVNSQGFTLMDMMSSSGGGRSSGGGMGRRGSMGNLGADLSSFRTSTRGGVRATNMIGLNYNGEVSDKLKITASYFFNRRQANNWDITERQYQTMPRMTYDSSRVNGIDNSHNLRLKLEWTPSKNDIITFSPRVRYTTNRGNSLALNEVTLEQMLNNSLENHYSTNLSNLDARANLWWTRRLGKAGRTLSIGGVVRGTRAVGDRYQLTGNNLAQPQDTVLNMIGSVTTSSIALTGSATYTEPLSKSSRLSINYMINYDRSFSDQQGLLWDKLLQDYALLDTATTNNLSRNYTTHTAGLAYNYVLGKKLTLTANLNYQLANLSQGQSVYLAGQPMPQYTTMRRPFNAVLPGFNITYTPTRTEKLSQSLAIIYNTNPLFPSVTQLQDVLNVSNPLNVSKGNPNLNQGFSQMLMLRYNIANVKNSSNFNIMVMGNATSNYIANHRRFFSNDTIIDGTLLTSGTQYTTPENLNGYYNLMAYATYSFRIKPLRSNMTVSGNYQFVQTPSIENGIKYLSFSNAIGATAMLTSNISEKVDFTVAYRPSINYSRNSSGSFDRYQSHNATLGFNVFIVKGLYLNADGSWMNNFGTQASYSQHYALVNAAIGYKFLKHEQADIKLSVYDALGQNRSVSQTMNDTYNQLQTTNILSRYFMLSFTYKFDTRKGRSGKSYGTNDSPVRGHMAMPGGMRPPH